MFSPQAFSVLFDIGGDLSDDVGYVSVNSNCKSGVELYDPFFKKCRNIVEFDATFEVGVDQHVADII